MDSGEESAIFSNWMWDFFLRQPVDDPTLKTLITALPPPPDATPNLKKLFLLKELESDSISENTLDSLAKLALQTTGAVSDTMRTAFCAAAVECTVNNYLNFDAGDGVKKTYKLYNVVKSLWKEKIEGMRDFLENGGLGSDTLWAWEKEIETGLWDDSVCESVMEKCGQVNGVEAVNAYVREEREKIGPSFLEVVSERVQIDKNLQKVMGIENVGGEEEMKEEKSKSKMKEVSSRGVRGTSGDNIVDANEATPGPSSREAGEPLQQSQATSSRVRDESIDGSQQGSDMNSKNISGRMKNMSIDGSKQGRDTKPTKRRKNRRWSVQEENVLRDAVEKHGRNWSVILLHNRDIFVGRTDGDLKDKYRNMTNVPKTPRF